MAAQTDTGAAAAPANPLLSSQSGSELQIILHPLVLLTISDYITRHTLRGQTSPVVGGLLGLQSGRDITVEHAFDCDMVIPEGGTSYQLNKEHFTTRLEMMRQVHMDRKLDLVGWYTLLPSTGPDPETAATQQIFQSFNESAILLGFHPDHAVDHSTGGKLPLTIYESLWEVSGDDRPQLKFRELPYSVEVDETEMISMNYVAAAGASAVKDEQPAAATTGSVAEKQPQISGSGGPSRSVESNGKGKRRLVEQAAEGSEEGATTSAGEPTLTTEEEELVASLTTRANAIKMLQSRIGLIKTYLEGLPPAPGTDVNMDGGATPATPTQPSLTVLRQIQALISRLDLVVPSNEEAFQTDLSHERADAQLIMLLDQIAQSTNQARDTGRKFAIVEAGKGGKSRRGGGGGGGGPSGRMVDFGAALSSMSGTGDLMMGGSG